MLMYMLLKNNSDSIIVFGILDFLWTLNLNFCILLNKVINNEIIANNIFKILGYKGAMCKCANN